MTYSGRLGDWYTSWGTKKAPVNIFFQFYFNKKYVEVAINDFTMHPIILKWLRRQKCRQKRKTMKQKELEAKEESVYESAFIHLNL